jgi:hypothetical protein
MTQEILSAQTKPLEKEKFTEKKHNPLSTAFVLFLRKTSSRKGFSVKLKMALPLL